MTAVVNVYSKLGPRVNKDFLQSLDNEGIIFDSKDIMLTFRARGLKGKGIYISSLKRLSKGRLISTKSRLIAIAGGHKIIDIPKQHGVFHSLTIDISDLKRYEIIIDLSIFQTDIAGIISLAYHISPDLVKI